MTDTEMDFEFECPKCRTRIDLTSRISEMVAERAEKAALSLIEAERRKAREEAQAQGRLLAEEAAGRTRLEAERAFSEKLQQKDLRISEQDKRLLEFQSKVQELEAKVHMGSAQTRGIIAEEDLFAYLKANLPPDRCEVEKRGQGKKGTDVILHVRSGGERVGSVIVDDKWASAWGREWPEKIWGDMQMHKADFAYIAVNASALPEELKEARFGLAPCRRAGVRVWVVDRSNLPLVAAILTDTADKLLKMSELKALYGSGSEAVRRFQEYLASGYETDLREKAKHMSAAVKGLNDLHKKVNAEYARIFEALKAYWAAESRVHQGLTASLGDGAAKPLPQIPFEPES